MDDPGTKSPSLAPAEPKKEPAAAGGTPSAFAPVTLSYQVGNEPAPTMQPEISAPIPGQQTNYSTGKLGGYSPHALHDMDISRHMWENSKHSAWNESPQGRAVIRLFSRGVMGAAFFTAGGLLTRKWMTGENQYSALKSFSEQKNPLQFIAKGIDTFVGKPIEAGVSAFAGREAGMRAVRFRPTKYATFGNQMRGRSLGDEAVNITFDFFSASVGDALGRDIATILDPNVKKSWVDDKGSIDYGKAAQGVGKSLFRYVTYNGGEDWAVAIPYAYFMKAQRSLINKASPGFQYDFDRQLNGGSFKMKDNKIVGNFNKEGMLDLQSRFTAYNVGTLMYREVYDHVENMLTGKKSSLYGAADKDKSHYTFMDKAAEVGKWMLRSAVKGTIVMTPAVPFFWSTRTPQTKHRGMFIDPEHGTLGMPPSGSKAMGDTIHANSTLPSAGSTVDYWRYNERFGVANMQKHGISSGRTTIGNVNPLLVTPNRFDAHRYSFGPVDSVFNEIGRANYKAAHGMSKVMAPVDQALSGITHPVKEFLGVTDHTSGRFMRPMTYAALSYTPYMYAKAEFANLWDNGKMDLSAERMIDGLTKLNWGEFKKGAHEVYNTVLYRPLPEPEREAEAKRRMVLDTSPPADFDKTQAEQIAAKHKLDSNWRERVITAPKERAPLVKAKGGDGASLDDYKKPKPEAPPDQLVERESLRKALLEMEPPTKSIN